VPSGTPTGAFATFARAFYAAVTGVVRKSMAALTGFSKFFDRLSLSELALGSAPFSELHLQIINPSTFAPPACERGPRISTVMTAMKTGGAALLRHWRQRPRPTA
jgi:hypothetical protein